MKPNEIHDRILAVAEDAADKSVKADRLEALAKATFSQIVAALITDGSSASAAEHHARSDPRYLDQVDQAFDARQEAGIAKAKLEATRCWFESWRTLEATKRIEMRL